MSLILELGDTMRLFIVVFLIFLPSMLFGAIDTDNGTAHILANFVGAANQWTKAIKPAGMYIFYSFTVIDMALTFGFMALKGFEFSEFMVELIRKIMWIGFFLFLFQSVDLLKQIPSSFIQIALNASGHDVEPDTIIESALTLVSALWHAMSISDVTGSILAAISGVICLAGFSIMAANLFMVLVKIQALIVGSYLIFGFGGLSYTRSMAINPLKAIFAAGMEMMFIKLFLGLTLDTVLSLEQNIGNDINSYMAIIVMSIILVSIIYMIPGIVSSLMSGSLGNTSTAGLGVAAASVGGAMAGGALAAKAGTGAAAAVKAAQDLSKAGGGSVMENIFKTVGKDVVDTISGKNARDTTSTGQRAADNMKQQTNSMNSAKEAAAAKESASYVNSVDASAFVD